MRLSVVNPAKSLGLTRGIIKAGEKADAVLFDPSVKTRVNNPHSLYNGEELSGKILMSFQGEKTTRF